MYERHVRIEHRIADGRSQSHDDHQFERRQLTEPALAENPHQGQGVQVHDGRTQHDFEHQLDGQVTQEDSIEFHLTKLSTRPPTPAGRGPFSIPDQRDNSLADDHGLVDRFARPRHAFDSRNRSGCGGALGLNGRRYPGAEESDGTDHGVQPANSPVPA